MFGDFRRSFASLVLDRHRPQARRERTPKPAVEQLIAAADVAEAVIINKAMIAVVQDRGR